MLETVGWERTKGNYCNAIEIKIWFFLRLNKSSFLHYCQILLILCEGSYDKGALPLFSSHILILSPRLMSLRTLTMCVCVYIYIYIYIYIHILPHHHRRQFQLPWNCYEETYISGFQPALTRHFREEFHIVRVLGDISRVLPQGSSHCRNPTLTWTY